MCDHFSPLSRTLVILAHHRKNPLPSASDMARATKAHEDLSNRVSQRKPGFLLSLAVLFILTAAGHAFGDAGRLDVRFPSLLADDAIVNAIEIQADGKILIAGKFTTAGAVFRKDVLRLNTDGSLDTSFNAGSGSDNIGQILAVKVQTDGKILVAGTFNTFNGEFRHSVVRLNADGSVDASFTLSGLDVTFAFDLDVQTDGKVLISVSNLIGLSFIARFNANGTNDGGVGQPFFSMSGSNSYKVVFDAAENNILATSRSFSPVNQVNMMRIAPTGGLDQTFAVTLTGTAFDLAGWVRPIGNGKILVCGKFDLVDQVPRKNIAIVNSDGSVDPLFVPATTGAETILAAAVQADGKIVVGGSGFTPNSMLRGNLGRLNADGSIDTTFRPGRGANASIKALKIASGSLFIGGDFFRYHIFPRAGLARIGL